MPFTATKSAVFSLSVLQQETFDIQAKLPWGSVSGVSKRLFGENIVRRWTKVTPDCVLLLYRMCGMPDLKVDNVFDGCAHDGYTDRGGVAPQEWQAHEEGRWHVLVDRGFSQNYDGTWSKRF